MHRGSLVALVVCSACRFNFEPVDDDIGSTVDPAGYGPDAGTAAPRTITAPSGLELIATCTAGAPCAVDCTAASSCIVDCHGASTCEVACGAAGCVVQACVAPACSVDCGGVAPITVGAVVTCQ